MASIPAEPSIANSSSTLCQQLPVGRHPARIRLPGRRAVAYELPDFRGLKVQAPSKKLTFTARSPRLPTRNTRCIVCECDAQETAVDSFPKLAKPNSGKIYKVVAIAPF
ncbi:unnamed protein product [Linum tenue]|uniref:Uncharacterized protein n=1 Tax=Linum tenue TaxID=586396 RepID=A0AAV0NR10_9ROSI|nr:unnamed protein product [Linum tenue]